MPDDGSSRVLRASFDSSDVVEVEQFLGATYTAMSIRVPRDRARFRFRHDAEAAPAFSVNRVTGRLTVDAGVPSMGSKIVVDRVLEGRISFTSGRHGEARAAEGGLLLGPTQEDFRVGLDECEVEVVTIDTDRVADYAAQVCGVGLGDFGFTGIAPVSDAMHTFWQRTVAHVRDAVLRDPFAGRSPILLESSFRMLAAALLSTFPNTAVERLTDPDSRMPTGTVPEATLRDVQDFLGGNADRPIGPGDIAEHTGLPAREIVAGLRRRHDVHPAQLLWRARLAGARRDLVDAEEPGRTVCEVAARWGFARARVFQVAYLREFGESPDDTLGRR